MSESRADLCNNPTAMTTDVAAEGGLELGTQYSQGPAFYASYPVELGAQPFYTAILIGDPIVLTIQVINKIGFYTETGAQRWEYIGIPKIAWDQLNHGKKRDVIGQMYFREGGITMRSLFPNFGPLV